MRSMETPRVLITRPEPQASELETQLEKEGIFSLRQPLFQILPGRDKATLAMQYLDLPPNSLVIFVSRSAVEHGCFTWREDLLHLAVGEKTASMLQRASNKTVITPSSSQDSEGMLAEIQTLNCAKHVLIVRGNGGRELMPQTLESWGFKVFCGEAYTREAIELTSSNLLDQWRAARINCIVVTSIEHLLRLFEVFQPIAQDWLAACHWICLSERIAQRAQTLGLKRISICKEPGNQAIVDCLMHI